MMQLPQHHHHHQQQQPHNGIQKRLPDGIELVYLYLYINCLNGASSVVHLKSCCVTLRFSKISILTIGHHKSQNQRLLVLLLLLYFFSFLLHRLFCTHRDNPFENDVPMRHRWECKLELFRAHTHARAVQPTKTFTNKNK